MASPKVFHALNAVFAAVVLVAALIDKHAAVRLTALVGVVWLAVLLIVPRLTSSRHFVRWQRVIQMVNAHRKYLGLWAAAWLTAHGVLAVWVYFGTLGGLFVNIERRPIIWLELVSLGILILLALMSNAWSYRHVRGWKHIQMAVWAIPPMAVVSSFLAAQDFIGKPPLLWIASVLLGLCIVAGVATIFTKPKQLTDWLRLSFLGAGTGVTLAVLQVQGLH